MHLYCAPPYPALAIPLPSPSPSPLPSPSPSPYTLHGVSTLVSARPCHPSFSLNSSTCAVSKIASRRWWCIESLLPDQGCLQPSHPYYICSYVYIYIYIYIYIHMHIYISLSLSIYLSLSIHIYIYMHIHRVLHLLLQAAHVALRGDGPVQQCRREPRGWIEMEGADVYIIS